MSDDWQQRLGSLGGAIRRQRQLAQMSLRQLADIAHVSNPYLSQIERGLHEPSVRVLRSISRALGISAEELLEQAGMLDTDASDQPGEQSVVTDTESAITADPHLSDEQKNALLGVYRSYRAANSR